MGGSGSGSLTKSRCYSRLHHLKAWWDWRIDLVSSGGTQRVFQDGDKAAEVGVSVSLGCVTNTTFWAVSITDTYFLTVPEAGSPG